MANKDELLAQYAAITGESTAKSREHLEANSWDLQAAIEDHYVRQNESAGDEEYEDEADDVEETAAPNRTGGFVLGDGSSTSRPARAAAQAAAQPKPKAQPKRGGVATLGDFNSSSKPDSDDEEKQDLFAGGEKSGLAVQNPSEDLKKKILQKAQKTGREGPRDEAEKRSNFAGPAQTLGGDDTPSRTIGGKSSKPKLERVKRILHFWKDGYSIDDGDLYRLDDPQNAETLRLIQSGRAPLHIMNVEMGQEVDVEVVPHEDNYVRPKRQYKAFEGAGNRLGAPTPGLSASSSQTMPGSFTSAPPPTSSSTATPATQPPTTQVDESKPTVTLRISLGSGTRLTSRFNTDQTIGDVYDFVQRAETARAGRNFVLATTFPTVELTDKSKVLGEMSEFKRGGAVVQKFT